MSSGNSNRNLVASFNPNVNSMIPTTIPSDPLFIYQWHLQNIIPGLLDLNVVDVWEDYTGAGVQVAVIDDGVQRTHFDLDGNYSTAKDWDFAGNDTNASPFSADDNHGTAVAGIIGAEAGNGGGVGVAHGSTIFGFRIRTFNNVTDAINNASGLLQTGGVNREADVVNMSIGNPNGIFFDTGLNLTALNTAINNAVVFGRDGLGTILVKSAGNERGLNHDTNASSWNANKHTISVAAVDQNGYVSSYSTHGASVLVSAFGTPAGSRGQVVTTDRTGNAGYSPSSYTSRFNGTSAAAPMVSGVVALMLEANPNLGWRDVQEILAYSARHVGTDVGYGTNGYEEYAWSFNGAKNWNGGGLHFSNDYGFGLVDAKAAVRLAETWGSNSKTSDNYVLATESMSLSSPIIIPDGNANGVDFLLEENTANISIEHFELRMSFDTTFVGDLQITVTSPSGTTSTLINNSGFGTDVSRDWTFTSNAFRGEESAGIWTVNVVDSFSGDRLTVNNLSIYSWGSSISNDDTFIFTEEYSDYAGFYGHTTNLNGGIGIDTINAAAVDSSTAINLDAGMGSIDGVTVSISGIENAIAGDGNDYLIGNSVNNYLAGMRGNDYLIGGDGNDSLSGGAGSDFLIGSNPYTVNSGSGEYDTLTGGADADVFVLRNAQGAYYQGYGYALITDFNRNENDTLLVFGISSDYSFDYVDSFGSSATDTAIYYNNDLIAILEDAYTSQDYINADFTFA